MTQYCFINALVLIQILEWHLAGKKSHYCCHQKFCYGMSGNSGLTSPSYLMAAKPNFG